MRLHARAQGDHLARMELSGILAPGIEYADGSTWVLIPGPDGRAGNRELSTGKVRQHIKQRRRPEGTYFGSRQGHSLCLLNPRRETRYFGAV